MLLIILAVGIVIVASGIFVWKKFGDQLYRDDNEWIYFVLNTVGIILIVISLFIFLIVGISYSDRMVIDQKIELYEAENQKIEESIKIAITEYKDYETGIINDLHTEDVLLIAGLYPDLKANTLVQKQIETYIANRQQIKELKEEKLEYEVYGWWLFLKKGG